MRRAARGLAILLALLGAGAAPKPHFSVSGRFLYEDREWGWSGWTGAWSEKPIRGADVLVLDAQHGGVLGRGQTDAQGEFAVECAAQGLHDVVVRVDASNRWARAHGAVAPRLAVLDDGGARWSAFSPVFPAHAAGTDLDAGTTTALSVLAAGSAGNPFNIYDLALAAWEHLQGSVDAAPHGALRVTWPSWTGSWAWGHGAHVADDDGYDDAVILHELGHLVHNLWSESDSPGGLHWFGDSDQDPRLAFSEGYATFFAATVLSGLAQPALYVDGDGADGVGGLELRLDLETMAPFTYSAEGSADEVAVACALHDVLDDELAADATPGADDDACDAAVLVDGLTREQAWWQVFAGPVRKARRASLNSAWDGWSALHGGHGWAELHEVFDAHGLRFWNDFFEPDGEPELATPLAADGNWSAEHTLYFAPELPAPNGTGDSDWFAVELLAGQAVRIETRYPAGAPDARTQADTHLVLFDPAGHKVAEDEDGGPGRNARIDAFVVEQPGTWRFRVESRDRVHRYGRYEVRVSLVP
jgi:hypothetical protein